MKKNTEPDILFQDNYLVIVNKPALMPVIPERMQTPVLSLKEHLENQLGFRLFTVHRIDKGTSGLVCFAKDEDTHHKLNELFQNHDVEKTYWAVVRGKLFQTEDTINQPIGQHSSGNGTMIIHPKGKKSITHFKVLKQFKSAAWLELKIETGRTHQIRIHMKWYGHPLLVDEKYGGIGSFSASSVKRNYKQNEEEERPIISRLTLHARELSFIHPKTNERLSFVAELPKDFRVLLQVLEKNN